MLAQCWPDAGPVPVGLDGAQGAGFCLRITCQGCTSFLDVLALSIQMSVKASSSALLYPWHNRQPHNGRHLPVRHRPPSALTQDMQQPYKSLEFTMVIPDFMVLKWCEIYGGQWTVPPATSCQVVGGQ